MTRVGVVTIAHGRHDHLLGQHRSLARSVRRPDIYVVVAMDDPDIHPATHDGLSRDVVPVDRQPEGLPLAAARNRGVERALDSGADVLVLLDVDCLAGRELVASYADIVCREPDTVWSGPVTYLPPPADGGYDLDRLEDLDAPHPARPAPPPDEVVRNGDPDLFWSLSFALGAAAWRRVGGFHEGYVGYGGEDTDFGRLVVRGGLSHGWAGGARAYHQFHAVSEPPVEHLDDILRNGALFSRRWGCWPMTGWLEEFEAQGLVTREGPGWRPTAGATTS